MSMKFDLMVHWGEDKAVIGFGANQLSFGIQLLEFGQTYKIGGHTDTSFKFEFQPDRIRHLEATCL